MNCFIAEQALHSYGFKLFSRLIANLTQERFALGNLRFAFDPFGREAVDHAEDAAALFGCGDDDLGRVGGGAEDAADFGHGLDGFEDVDREEAVA